MRFIEWQQSDDIQRMLNHLWQQCTEEHIALVKRKLLAYHAACCRSIWVLLPDPRSRSAVKHLEWFLAGQATQEELDDANYSSEAVVLGFRYNIDPEKMAVWCQELENLSNRSSHVKQFLDDTTPSKLLYLAADFVDSSSTTSNWNCTVPVEFLRFHSVELLRKHIEWPG
jgi:hypothetical protein